MMASTTVSSSDLIIATGLIGSETLTLSGNGTLQMQMFQLMLLV